MRKKLIAVLGLLCMLLAVSVPAAQAGKRHCHPKKHHVVRHHHKRHHKCRCHHKRHHKKHHVKKHHVKRHHARPVVHKTAPVVVQVHVNNVNNTYVTGGNATGGSNYNNNENSSSNSNENNSNSTSNASVTQQAPPPPSGHCYDCHGHGPHQEPQKPPCPPKHGHGWKD